MHTGHALLLLSIAFTACAGTGARATLVPLPARVAVEPTQDAAARLGPPSPRGLGSRHIERPTAAEAPLARY